MTAESTDFDEANHITGDYYFLNDIAAWKWIAAAFLCVTLPPVGGFFVAWFAVGCIKSEEQLTEEAPD
jgi:hypothetical protein